MTSNTGVLGGGASGANAGILGGATGGRGGSGSSGPNASNFLGPNYANVYVTALPATDTGASTNSGSGNSSSRTQKLTALTNTRAAFGSATYNTTTSGSRGGTATVRSGARGTGGTTNSNQANGFSVGSMSDSSSRTPRYAAALRFQAPTRPAGELQAELKNLVISAESAPSRQKVTLQVTARSVTLTGEVSSEDERRHIEMLVRLTPGVSEIKNELTVKE